MNVEQILKSDKPMDLVPRTIIHLILVAHKLEDALTQTLKSHEVSQQQFNVLRILRGQKGKPAHMGTINERMICKMSNTTRLVDKLVDKGYVERAVCPDNRRRVEVIITPVGLEALDHMSQAMTQAEKELLADLSVDELEQLNTLLDKF